MSSSDYGLWLLVVINSAVFVIFAFSFTRPRTKRDWRSFGAFSAFLVALFTEMYGFPLTIYLLSGWLSSRYPGVDLFSHNNGHLPAVLLGWEGNPHLNPLHILSYILIAGGYILLAAAWNVLYRTQRATDCYRRPIHLCAPSTIRRRRSDHAGVPAPVADTSYASDVSRIGDHVRPAGLARGARGAGSIPGGVRSVRRHYPCLLPTPGLR